MLNNVDSCRINFSLPTVGMSTEFTGVLGVGWEATSDFDRF